VVAVQVSLGDLRDVLCLDVPENWDVQKPGALEKQDVQEPMVYYLVGCWGVRENQDPPDAGASHQVRLAAVAVRYLPVGAGLVDELAVEG
jgi:hypothetical protein